MKRLIGLAVLFVVLCVSVPSYGYTGYYSLIYNVSTKVNGADYATDTKVTIPLKGYLVLKFADGCDTLADANLILYGKDTSKNKVYVLLNHSAYNASLGVNVWHINDLVFVNIWGESDFSFQIMLQGKVASKDIGLGANDMKQIAGSIKGVNMAWDGFMLGPDSGQEVAGTAIASASLWTKETKTANSDSWTQEEILQNLITILAAKGYTEATP